MGIFSRLFGDGGKVKTTAGNPFVIANPTIGFLNLRGADSAELARADAALIAPLFSRHLQSTQSPPRCEVLFIYCDVDAAGAVKASALSLRDLIKAAGAYVAVVASDNAADAYMAAMRTRNDWTANIALALDRRGVKLAAFFHRLFEAMFAGKSMPMAWVALAPQIPGREDPDAPSTIMVAEAGHVTFARRAA